MNSTAKKKSVLVFVHDAGGAEVIGAYILKNRDKYRWHAYGAGPSKHVFRRLRIPLSQVGDSFDELSNIVRKHKDVSFALIAAPGWMTKTEINALESAKHAGIKTVVYMDSWVDERRRFGYPKKKWQDRLPDEFWAGDRFARARLKKWFPHIPVRFVPNQYFKDEIRRFRNMKKNRPKSESVVFMSTTGGESHALLERLLRACAKQPGAPIVIRFHPAENHTRYDALIRTFNASVRIEKSKEKDIVRDLARARVVIGSETMALVIATLCGIRTVNFVGNRAAMLPFPSIRKARTPQAATRLALK